MVLTEDSSVPLLLNLPTPCHLQYSSHFCEFWKFPKIPLFNINWKSEFSWILAGGQGGEHWPHDKFGCMGSLLETDLAIPAVPKQSQNVYALSYDIYTIIHGVGFKFPLWVYVATVFKYRFVFCRALWICDWWWYCWWTVSWGTMTSHPHLWQNQCCAACTGTIGYAESPLSWCKHTEVCSEVTIFWQQHLTLVTRCPTPASNCV